jgi:cytochrome c553
MLRMSRPHPGRDVEPAIPGLAGLHASYISAQLGAATLTETDVTAVAAWLASLPIPTDPSPVPKGTLPMPLACGSEPN